MILAIADVLSAADVAEVRAGLATATFVDGKATAGWSAKLVKANLQASRGPELERVRALVETRLTEHAVFALATRPKTILGPAVLALPAGPRLRPARRRCADGRRAHRRRLHAVPVDAGELRGRRADHRHARRRGGVQARRRQRRDLSRNHAASRGAGDARRAAGGGGLGAQLRARGGAAASCCSIWRRRAGACSTARARPRTAICSPSAPPTCCACGARIEAGRGRRGRVMAGYRHRCSSAVSGLRDAR